MMPVIHGARKVTRAVNDRNLEEIAFLGQRRKELRAQVGRWRVRAREAERQAAAYWRLWHDLKFGE